MTHRVIGRWEKWEKDTHTLTSSLPSSLNSLENVSVSANLRIRLETWNQGWQELNLPTHTTVWLYNVTVQQQEEYKLYTLLLTVFYSIYNLFSFSGNFKPVFQFSKLHNDEPRSNNLRLTTCGCPPLTKKPQSNPSFYWARTAQIKSDNKCAYCSRQPQNH